MGSLESIERQLAEVFKGLHQFPDSTKETLAEIWPWLALIGGVLQLWAALLLYHLATFTDKIINAVNSVSRYYVGQPVGPSSFDKTVIYLGVLLLVVEAVILLMAFPKLQKREKGGWDLLFLGALINIVYGFVQIPTFQRGIWSFLGSLIASFIGLYLLFQVREKFKAKKSETVGPVSHTKSKK